MNIKVGILISVLHQEPAYPEIQRKLILKKNQQMTKKPEKLPFGQTVNLLENRNGLFRPNKKRSVFWVRV